MLSANFEKVIIDGVSITMDVSLTAKTKEIYINASDIATAFNINIEDFLRTGSTNEYIQAIIQDEESPLKNMSDILQNRKGKYPGIYLLDELAFGFAGVCSPVFRRSLCKWVTERLNKEEERIENDHKKKLDERERLFCAIPQGKLHAHDPVSFYNDSDEEDMINEIVLGSQFEILEQKYGEKNIRACMNAAQLSEVNRLKILNAAFLAVGMVDEDRFDYLEESVDSKLSLIRIPPAK